MHTFKSYFFSMYNLIQKVHRHHFTDNLSFRHVLIKLNTVERMHIRTSPLFSRSAKRESSKEVRLMWMSPKCLASSLETADFPQEEGPKMIIPVGLVGGGSWGGDKELKGFLGPTAM